MILAAMLLAVAGCTKHTHRERGNTPDPGSHTSQVELRNRSDWSVTYLGREDYTEDDGRIIRVEHIRVVCPEAGYYILRTIYDDDLKNPDLYNNDRKAFFEAEAKYLREDAAYYGDKVTDYFYTEESHEYLLDRLRMGEHRLFVIGMDKDGYITGDYAEAALSLKEETPTEGYLKWLGDWKVGHGTVMYPVTVEQGEANFSYIFRGWETGDSIDPDKGTVMDQEYLETYYDVWNGNMYFSSQYLGTYEDNGRNLDELFLGKVNITTAADRNDNGIWIITDEGLDLAAAVLPVGESNVATITGCDVTAAIGTQDIPTQFVTMQYFAAYMDGNNVAYDPYNANVPDFPLTMTRTTVRSGRALPALQPRPVTRASIHHAQPRARGENRTVARAVRAE